MKKPARSKTLLKCQKHDQNVMQPSKLKSSHNFGPKTEVKTQINSLQGNQKKLPRLWTVPWQPAEKCQADAHFGSESLWILRAERPERGEEEKKKVKVK